MVQVNHIVLIDNEMTALADDFRGLGEFVDVCNQFGVRIGVDTYENRLKVFTEPTERWKAEAIVHALEHKAPVFPEIEEI